MNQIRCRVTFHSYTNKTLINFCSLVAGGIYTNTAIFATPVITNEEFQRAQVKFSDAVSKYDNAPKIERTNLKNARTELMQTVDKIKDYVDGVAKGDESIIILGGFTPTKGAAEKSKPVEKTNDFEPVRTKVLGEAEVTVNYSGSGTPQWYFVICSTDATLPSNLVENGIINFGALPDGVRIDVSKSKKKLFTNLDSNVVYYFYAFVGNTNNIAPLSDPKSLKVF